MATRGERPTVERVRAELGGSPNSITPLVREWRETRQTEDAPHPGASGQPVVEPGTLAVVIRRALEQLAHAVAALPAACVAATAEVAEKERRRSQLELEAGNATAQQALNEARALAEDERSACDAVRSEASEATTRLAEREQEIVTLRQIIEADKAQIASLTAARDQDYVARDEAERRARILADEVYEERKEAALARATAQATEVELARVRAESAELAAAADAARERVTSLTVEVAVERQRTDGERQRAERAEADAERSRRERAAANAAALDAMARVARVEAKNELHALPGDVGGAASKRQEATAL